VSQDVKDSTDVSEGKRYRICKETNREWNEAINEILPLRYGA